MNVDTAVVNGLVVIPGQGVVEADLGIQDGRIVVLQGGGESLGADDVIDARGFPRKGTLTIGSDADLTIVDLNAERIVKAADLGSAGDFSVYEGRTPRGWPVLTMVRSKVSCAMAACLDNQDGVTA